MQMLIIRMARKLKHLDKDDTLAQQALTYLAENLPPLSPLRTMELRIEE